LAATARAGSASHPEGGMVGSATERRRWRRGTPAAVLLGFLNDEPARLLDQLVRGSRGLLEDGDEPGTADRSRLGGRVALRRRGLCLAQAPLLLPPVLVHQHVEGADADGEAANDGGA